MKKTSIVFVFIVILFGLSLRMGVWVAEKDLNFSYEELSTNLLRIEYVEFKLNDDHGYDINKILILNDEEKEYVLHEMSKIIFKTRYGEPNRTPAKALIFVYEEYEVWVKQRYIVRHSDSEVFDKLPDGKQGIYYIKQSEGLQKLLEYIDLNFVNK